jgi:hypothetical protein
MIQIPDFVLNHLIVNGQIGKTKTLIIGENYPGLNYAKSYFYRSIPGCPGGPATGNPPAFFNNFCNALLVPHLNLSGKSLNEFERLNKFLDSGFLIIDAQQNLIKPQNPAILSPKQIDDLIMTILLINPKNIIFLTENNNNVLISIRTHPLFARIQPKIIINFLRKRNWFCFPSAPANPNLFKEEIEFARQYYFI